MDEKDVKTPLEIETKDILDHQARWICQRLDKILNVLHELTIELRDMSGSLKEIERAKT